MLTLAALWANPLTKKIVIYGAVTLAAMLILRWYGNRQWSKGEAEGRLKMAEEITKAKASEWAEKEREIELEQARIIADKAALEDAREALAKSRVSISNTLDRGLERITAERLAAYEASATVPDDELWDAIRAMSKQLSSDTGGTPGGSDPSN